MYCIYRIQPEKTLMNGWLGEDKQDTAVHVIFFFSEDVQAMVA